MSNTLIKSKTFANFISGIPNDVSLLKSLTVGDTKVMNGATYIVKMTPSGVPDWRKLKADGTDDDEVDYEKLNNLFDNTDFPDVSDIKVNTSVNLGGSTGAQLVENKKTGEKFVLKKGASVGHVQEEFLTNSLYKLLGARVPEMKLYTSSTSTFILSKFMENTTPANHVLDDVLREEITEHFVADCLLANWDAYKNDNILINDDDGFAIRVDNGGGLRYSAQGRTKGSTNFGGNVDELVSMMLNNKNMTSGITQDMIKEQIQEIVKIQDDILNLIEDFDLKDIMRQRIQFLESKIVSPQAAPSKKKFVASGKELTEKQLEDCFHAVGGDIEKKDNKNGWLFLHEIAKLRGADDIPEVVGVKKFNNLIADKSNILVHRGLTGTSNSTARQYMDEFVAGECFLGNVGIYGAGIYGAVNKERGNYTKSNPAWETALSYANYEEEHIVDFIIPKNAKVIDTEKIDEMMQEEFFGKEFAKKKSELDEEVRNMYEMKNKIEDFEKAIETQVKSDMGWNEKTYDVLLRSRPEAVYADTDKHPFSKALNYFEVVTKSLNGKITKLDEHNFEVSLPNSRNTFILNSHAADIALKQKNEFSVPYNFHYQQFKKFILNNHYKGIEKKVNERITEEKANNADILKYKDSMIESDRKVKSISKEVNDLKTNGNKTMNKIMSAIASRPNGEYRGFYAAIKGYDVMIQEKAHRNSGDDKTFAIILNRSKLIIKKYE